MAEHVKLQTTHFTENGCAITGLTVPSPKETALKKTISIRRQVLLLL
jgi:hypothetical protein